jgi:rare lipoprotein A
MVVRLGAAICGAAILLALVSSAMAESEIMNVYLDVGEITANGEYAYSGASAAARRALAFVMHACVTNQDNGRCVIASSVPFIRSDLRLEIAAYQSLLAPLAVIGSGLNQWDAAPVSVTIVGTASMYDPFRPGYDSGGIETASGELYDPIAWTAAIQTDLRETFGGVRYGKDYRPAYALVEAADKRAIIKINDVGPLKPGRVIDFNKQTMRYFDPSLQLGIVHSVKITPLLGDGWAPGPINL